MQPEKIPIKKDNRCAIWKILFEVVMCLGWACHRTRDFSPATFELKLIILMILTWARVGENVMVVWLYTYGDRVWYFAKIPIIKYLRSWKPVPKSFKVPSNPEVMPSNINNRTDVSTTLKRTPRGKIRPTGPESPDPNKSDLLGKWIQKASRFRLQGTLCAICDEYEIDMFMAEDLLLVDT